MNSINFLQHYHLKLSLALGRRACFLRNLWPMIIFYLLLMVSGGLATGQTVSGQRNFLDLYLGEIYSEKGTSNQHTQALDVQTAMHQPVRPDESKTAKCVPSNFAAGATLEETTCKAPHEEARISPVKRRLWKDRISIYTHEDDTASKEELHKIIEQIRAIKFEPRNKTVEDVNVTEQTSVAETTEPKEEISESKAIADPNNKKQEAKRQLPLPEGIITDQTLQIVRDLCQDPCQVENPFELAEIMFQSDHLREASILYHEAIACKTTKQAGGYPEKAWILFQIGNCLRDEDRPAAKKVYKQLIAEYPDSPWTDLARAQDKLLDWYLKEKPQELIESAILK